MIQDLGHSAPRVATDGGVFVSIHDVSPAHADAVRTLWDACRRVGVVPALLVVPEWHGTWPLEADRPFVRWLQGCRAEGAVIVLHGERHDEEGLPRGWADRWRALGQTAAEGEFLTLDRDAARGRIVRGIARLAALDLPAQGFIPPAWLARPTTHGVVAECGLSFSEDVTRVYWHAAGTVERMPVLRWSARTSWRAAASVAVTAWRWRQRGRLPRLRIALHPQDLAHRWTQRSLEGALAAWTAIRPVRSYADNAGAGAASSTAS